MRGTTRHMRQYSRRAGGHPKGLGRADPHAWMWLDAGEREIDVMVRPPFPIAARRTPAGKVCLPHDSASGGQLSWVQRRSGRDASAQSSCSLRPRAWRLFVHRTRSRNRPAGSPQFISGPGSPSSKLSQPIRTGPARSAPGVLLQLCHLVGERAHLLREAREGLDDLL
jgi:hypothetical protein